MASVVGIPNLPELVEPFTIAGDPDALVRPRMNDLDHLKHVIEQHPPDRQGHRVA